MKNSEKTNSLFSEIETSETSTETSETSTETFTTTPIDIGIIAQKLINNLEIIDKAKKQKIIINADKLSKKIPDLVPLEKMPLVAIGMRNNVPYTLIPCLYREGEKSVIVLPDLNASVEERLILKSFRTGKNGYTIVSFNDLLLKIAIAQSEDHLSELEENDLLYDGVEGIASQLDLSFLKEKPIIEIPLKNLPLNTEFKIIGIGKVSKQFKTPLIDVSDNSGNIYLNIICNVFLARFSSHLGMRFKITSIIEETQKTKKGTQKITKATILPLDGVDLSSL